MTGKARRESKRYGITLQESAREYENTKRAVEDLYGPKSHDEMMKFLCRRVDKYELHPSVWARTDLTQLSERLITVKREAAGAVVQEFADVMALVLKGDVDPASVLDALASARYGTPQDEDDEGTG